MSDERRCEPVMPSVCRTGGCGCATTAAEPIFPSFGEVRVNGVEIAPEAIAKEIQHHPAGAPEATWRAAARALVVRELLLQEAARLGVEADPQTDAAGRRETVEDARVRALLEDLVVAEAPSEADCRRFYEARRARFRTPELFEAAHILIEPEGGDWAAAEAEARALAFAVGDDARAFAVAARERSACPSAQQEGSLGQIRRGELETPVQQALEALAEGTTARAPVRSRHGWHVVRLHRRVAGGEAPFEAVQPAIAEMLEARSWARAAATIIRELAARAAIEGVCIETEEGA
jgi:peptidyl-prolyl cis-trans isomerase C